MAEYGIPYLGSKGKICNQLIKIFPKADHFYDLFGGGFSITHAMLLRRSRDYKNFHFNEIRPGICDLIRRAIAGEFNYDRFKPTFVDREEFFRNVETNPYIKMVWSFGNNGSGYLFSKEIEPYKKSMHNAIVFNEFDDLSARTLGMPKFKDGYSIHARRLYLRNRIEFFLKTKMPEFLHIFLNEQQLQQLERLQQLQQLERLQELQQLQQLEQLERLERLEQLQQLQLERLQQLQLERLEFNNVSYEQVPIMNNSVVYCDPPYLGTAGYGGDFDHKAFLDWCDAQNNPVFISEYEIKDKRFHLVKTIKKMSVLSSKNRDIKIEKIYVNASAWKLLSNPNHADSLAKELADCPA